jgi:Sel1 repeat
MHKTNIHTQHHAHSRILQSVSTLILSLTLFITLFAPLPVGANEFKQLSAGQNAFNVGDFKRSFFLWNNLAAQGDTDAQVFIGLSYQNGWGIQKNLSLSHLWYQKAAQNNNASGQYLLGLQYIRGNNDERRKGLAWLKRAALNGDSAAQAFIEKGQKRGWFSHIKDIAL